MKFDKHTHNPAVKRTKQSTVKQYFGSRKSANDTIFNEVEDQFNQLQAQMVNNCNLPDCFVECKYYRNVIDCSLKNAQYLKKSRRLGRRKLHTIQAETFVAFTSKLKAKLDGMRQYYIDLTGEPQKFIIVGNDVWESKRKDIHGLTIFFTVPRTMETFRVDVALTYVFSKKAELRFRNLA